MVGWLFTLEMYTANQQCFLVTVSLWLTSGTHFCYVCYEGEGKVKFTQAGFDHHLRQHLQIQLQEKVVPHTWQRICLKNLSFYHFIIFIIDNSLYLTVICCFCKVYMFRFGGLLTSGQKTTTRWCSWNSYWLSGSLMLHTKEQLEQTKERLRGSVYWLAPVGKTLFKLLAHKF